MKGWLSNAKVLETEILDTNCQHSHGILDTRRTDRMVHSLSEAGRVVDSIVPGSRKDRSSALRATASRISMDQEYSIHRQRGSRSRIKTMKEH